ncbi:D-2-hydroxyacid dehydrogenase [Vibrio sp. SM6]|uniref:D-2-hydroxyacid dehydrogenase n=1 Tax=Vibrio agarilyticus TaxID=2726741 RepID=A0A7X8TSG6_9VIBR|nr:D-2-hydroxyacid dehydrogenase [Vibrio agarilyticus]NLS13968.1 D-2-hydroxyacid dehydrogenase [Vibrio agarilyticus]
MPHSTHKIFIATDSNSLYRDLFHASALPGLEETQLASEANIILADPPRIAPHLHQFSALAWLQSTYAGVNALLQPNARQDYLLTNVRDIFGPLIAEYVLGYAIAHYRHLPQYAEQQRRGAWLPMPYRSLQGETLLILGTGNIAVQLAHVANAFGLRVLGVNRTGAMAQPHPFAEVFSLSELPQAIGQCQLLVNTLPSTPQTQNVLNRETLKHAQNILLFNVGRGDALNDDDLLAAIAAHSVQHAYLDVFHYEPLETQHPFWSSPSVTLTPHIAAISSPEQVWQQFCDNYQRFCLGAPLKHLIDFARGY